jgi:hypothetical protein
MTTRIQSWKKTIINASLCLAIFSGSLGCTNTTSNQLPSRNTKIPSPKLTTGGAASPALNQFNSSGVSNNLGSSNNATSTNGPVNNTGMMPSTKIGTPDPNRPNPQSAFNSNIGIPTSTFNNPASFGGPKTTWNSTNSQVTPVSNLTTNQTTPKTNTNSTINTQPLDPLKNSAGTSNLPEGNGLTPMNSGSNEFHRSTEPIGTKKSDLEPIPPTPGESSFYPTNSGNSGSTSKVTTPVNVPSTSGLPPLKLPDTEMKVNTTPELDRVKPVSINSSPSAFDPVPYSVNPPVLEPQKGTFTPTTKTSVPLPVISSEIPPAPVVPQNGPSLKIP